MTPPSNAPTIPEPTAAELRAARAWLDAHFPLARPDTVRALAALLAERRAMLLTRRDAPA